MFNQKVVDGIGNGTGKESFVFIPFHIAPIQNRGNGRGVGGRPADAVLFKGLNERGIRVARGGFCLMALGFYTD